MRDRWWHSWLSVQGPMFKPLVPHLQGVSFINGEARLQVYLPLPLSTFFSYLNFSLTLPNNKQKYRVVFFFTFILNNECSLLWVMAHYVRVLGMVPWLEESMQLEHLKKNICILFSDREAEREKDRVSEKETERPQDQSFLQCAGGMLKFGTIVWQCNTMP